MLWVVPVKPWHTSTPMSLPAKKKGSAPGRMVWSVMEGLRWGCASGVNAVGSASVQRLFRL